MIKNESDESAKIVANISNGSSDSNYKSTRLSLQGKLEFSGDNSGFVNAEVIASGANVEFAGANSMFNAPLRLRDNSVAEISESIDHDKDISVHKGSKLLIKKRSTLSGGSLFLFPY